MEFVENLSENNAIIDTMETNPRTVIESIESIKPDESVEPDEPVESVEPDESDEPILYDKYSRTSLMELVEPILKKYYTNPIGRIDASTLPNSGTGYLYAKLIDDFTIVRIMHNEKRIGYIIQIYEYSKGIKCRSALLFSHRTDNSGFNFHGRKEFYQGCYVDPRDVLEVIKNLHQLIKTGSVDVTKESWDWDDANDTYIKNTNTHKFELFVV